MPRHHAALASLVGIIWGINFVVIHLGLQDIPPLTFAALRFAAVVVPAIFIIPKPPLSWAALLGIGLFMSAGQFGLLYCALGVGMPAGLAALVLQLQVVLTMAGAAVALHERPTARQAWCAASAMAGLALIAVGRAASTPLLGILLTVAAAASWSLGNVIARRAARALPTPDPHASRWSTVRAGLGVPVWSSLVVPLPLLGASLALDGSDAVVTAVTHLTPVAVASTLYTVVLSTLLGYGVWNVLLRHHPAAAVTPFALLAPVVGGLAAWLVLGEMPNVWEALGGAVVLAGVAAAVWPSRRQRQARRLLKEERRAARWAPREVRGEV